MKTSPILFLTTLFTLTSASAFAGPDEAWEHLKNAGRDVRNGVFRSVEEIKAASRDVSHGRPFLMSEYVTVVKKGKEVTLVYCESRLKRIADAQRCEKLHSGAFKIDDLKSCIDKVEGDRQPGMILNRNLKTVAESDYGHDHFKMYDSKDAYRDYLGQCQAALNKKPSRAVAARPAEKKAEEKIVPPELNPLEVPAAGEAPPFDVPVVEGGKL